MQRLRILLLAGPALVAAQDPRGSIGGRVTDSSGAVIPGAAIRCVQQETGVAVKAASNEQGRYECAYLNPGVYRVEVQQTGFKRWVQPGVVVSLGDRKLVDIPLDVGEMAESVEVSAQAPVLEAANASVGQVLTQRQVANLPLRNGAVSYLFAFAPGVVMRRVPSDGPHNVVSASEFSGGGGNQFDFNLDGVSNNSYQGNIAFIPSQDMVQEVRVETASYDASSGHSSGGYINIALKSGTNELHGTASLLAASGPMMTRNFFTNRFIFDPRTGPITEEKIRDNTPSPRWQRLNLTAGGPLLIPRLYNGRNRTFWLFGFTRNYRHRSAQRVYATPTEAMRAGDFSALLPLGAQYQIYDPYTTQASGASRFSRQPLPGNRVPAARIDGTARQILKYFPLPNQPGTADFQNNFNSVSPDVQPLYQPVVRVDHHFSERWRMFARYTQTMFTGSTSNIIPNSPVLGQRRNRPHQGVAYDNVFVLSPRLLLDLRYGYTFFQEYQFYSNQGWDLREFGFPESLLRELDPPGVAFPNIQIRNMIPLGNDGGFRRKYYTHSLAGVLSWMRGNHGVRVGTDLRGLLDNTKTYGNVAPRLDFNETYTRGPLDNSPVAPMGQSMAMYLYGIPTGGWADLNDSRAEASRFAAGYVQDDWRIAPRLTLNLGFRWEYEGPNTERYNRATRDFDFTAINPIEEMARRQYAAAPIPEIPVDRFRTAGGVTFTGLSGNPRGIRDPYYRALMPRFGFAYQPSRKWVARGGYGIFFSLLGAEFSDVAQPGFNQRTNIVPSLDNGVTYVASMSDPLPAGLEKPAGAAGGLRTFLGRSPGFFASDGRRPYTQRWNFHLQFEPAPQTLFEAGYLGTRSVRLRVRTEMNPVPMQYLSTLPVRDQPVIDSLTARTGNPFRGIPGFEGTALFAGANLTRSQLVRPYPHFGSLNVDLPAGAAWYHALTLRLDRRAARGLHVQANYTWSKTIEAVEYLNETDSLPHKAVSDMDRPHRLSLSVMYDLPFGRGQRFASSAPALLNHVIAGWQVHALYQGQSGPPLSFGNVIYNGRYQDLKLPAPQQAVERWFNTEGFERNPQRQLQNNIRTFPLRISGVRGDGINMWDFAAHKDFRIRERIKLQLRAEAEGAMNTPNFAPPNTDPTSTLFGQITATLSVQEERRIFVGIKLIF